MAPGFLADSGLLLAEFLLIFIARCYVCFFPALVLWYGEPSVGLRPLMRDL